MRYLALCCDYDGTLAEEGTASRTTINAVERLRASGRRVVLVTGRILEELQTVFTRLDLFDRVVAENGASLYNPTTAQERLLSERPPQLFVQTLRDRGVRPLSVGRVIVAAWQPHQTIVLGAIRDLGLELQVIFNKDAVMVLPSGVNKASGLGVALRELNVSPHNVVGIGDAENDFAFLGACEVAVAVDNALPLLKGAADFVTRGARGAGVVELIDELLKDDLHARSPRLGRRHPVVVGLDESGHEILLRIPDFNALLIPTSAAVKSALVAGLLERLAAQGYNYCLLDAGGNYRGFEGATTLGSATRGATQQEVEQGLSTYDTNLVIDITAVTGRVRVEYFLTLLQQIEAARLKCGRPHLLVINEIHRVFPADQEPSGLEILAHLSAVLRISTQPKLVAPAALVGITLVLATGTQAQGALCDFSAANGMAVPSQTGLKLQDAAALYWALSPPQTLQKITLPSAAAGARNR